jgi:hypothetical protein
MTLFYLFIDLFYYFSVFISALVHFPRNKHDLFVNDIMILDLNLH